MASSCREYQKTTLRLLPTTEQRAKLDCTWMRCLRLMNVVNDTMIDTGQFAHSVVGPKILPILLATADGRTMSIPMLEGCIRTVSRHCKGKLAGPACRVDWTDPTVAVALSITGKSVTILRGGDASIQTATGRERMPYELVRGNPAVLRESHWQFYWFQDDAGEHLIEWRPGELQFRRWREISAANNNVAQHP